MLEFSLLLIQRTTINVAVLPLPTLIDTPTSRYEELMDSCSYRSCIIKATIFITCTLATVSLDLAV